MTVPRTPNPLPETLEPGSAGAQAWLDAQPADPCADGPGPAVGATVECVRASDGKVLTGLVEENRLGLFLLTDAQARVVLTAALWRVRTVRPAAL